MVQQIHHTQIKKAQKMGIALEPTEHGQVAAFWPAHNLRISSVDGKTALEHMLAAVQLVQRYEGAGNTIRIHPDLVNPPKVFVEVNGQRTEESKTPMVWNSMEAIMVPAPDVDALFEEDSPSHYSDGTGMSATDVPFEEDEPPTIDGVPTNGGVAHRAGFTMLDSPYGEGNGEQHKANKWNAEWEASADEADKAQEEAEQEEAKQGSVVKTKYRAKYAELGHPTHCGDELAVKLNNLLLDGSHTNIDYFQMLMAANNVDMSKYKTTGNGWQGRYRMTGRNMLAKKVHSAGGVLKLPNGEEMRMSAEWLAAQRYK